MPTEAQKPDFVPTEAQKSPYGYTPPGIGPVASVNIFYFLYSFDYCSFSVFYDTTTTNELQGCVGTIGPGPTHMTSSSQEMTQNDW